MATPPQPAAPQGPPPPAPADDLPETGVRPIDPAARQRRRLLRNARLVDVAAGVARPDQDVLVADGRVQQVGQGLEGADEVVDLGGRYLMPGLISLHVHPGMMVGLRMDPAGQSPERYKHDLQVWLRYGVTTVQAMGTDRDFAFDVQREQREGGFTGARVFTVGHGFGAPGGAPGFSLDPPGPVRPSTPAEVRPILDDLARRGASGVKLWFDDIYGQMPKMAPEVARAIIEGCRDLGLTSYAHVYYVDDARVLVEWGLDVLAHMPRDREADPAFVDLLRERGVAAIPTITVPETNIIWVDEPAWVDDPFFGRFLPPGSGAYLRDPRVLAAIRARPEFPSLRPDLERAKRNTALLHAGGARLAFGTDCGVTNRVIGFYEHRELELLVEQGVSPAEALRIATLDSAAVLGQSGELGEIAPGHRADFVVLRDDPLASIRNTRSIESVWSDGVLVGDRLL